MNSGQMNQDTWEKHPELSAVLSKEEDKYEYLRQLGGGGYSRVYLVRQKILNEQRALKIMDSEYIIRNLERSGERDIKKKYNEIKERFLNEAKLYKKIKHPNVVEVIDVGFAIDKKKEYEIPYITMPYIAGLNLAQRLKDGPHLDIEATFQFSEQILSALDTMHKQGVIHRDIKPANIMLKAEKNDVRPILIDFGIAKDILDESSKTATGEPLGTPAYMSPEQFHDFKNLDYRADIYSFGIILFEILAGEIPFRSTTFHEAMHDHMHRDIPDIRKKNPGLPEDITRIIYEAMAKAPDDRFQNAEDFLNAIIEIKKNKTGLATNIAEEFKKEGEKKDDTEAPLENDSQGEGKESSFDIPSVGPVDETPIAIKREQSQIVPSISEGSEQKENLEGEKRDDTEAPLENGSQREDKESGFDFPPVEPVDETPVDTKKEYSQVAPLISEDSEQKEKPEGEKRDDTEAPLENGSQREDKESGFDFPPVKPADETPVATKREYSQVVPSISENDGQKENSGESWLSMLKGMWNHPSSRKSIKKATQTLILGILASLLAAIIVNECFYVNKTNDDVPPQKNESLKRTGSYSAKSPKPPESKKSSMVSTSKEYQQFINLAKECLKKGDFSSALSNLEKAEQIKITKETVNLKKEIKEGQLRTLMSNNFADLKALLTKESKSADKIKVCQEFLEKHKNTPGNKKIDAIRREITGLILSYQTELKNEILEQEKKNGKKLYLSLNKPINLTEFLDFKKKFPNSIYLTTLKTNLIDNETHLPPDKYWDDVDTGSKLKKNGKSYYEYKFGPKYNNHVMIYIPKKKIWIDKYEVSWEQFKNYLKEKNIPYAPPENSRVIRDGDQYPAVVTYKDAISYCLQYGLQLPTIEEWEWAAGKGRLTYPWGEESPTKPDAKDGWRANRSSLDDPTGEDGYNGTAPVKSFQKFASPYGAVNMAGNVWEWIQGKSLKGGDYFSLDDEDLKIETTRQGDDQRKEGFRCVKAER